MYSLDNVDDLNRSVKMVNKYEGAGGVRFTERRKTGGIYTDKKVPGPGFYNHYT